MPGKGKSPHFLAVAAVDADDMAQEPAARSLREHKGKGKKQKKTAKPEDDLSRGSPQGVMRCDAM